mmetsp:Transcript_11787/g.32819  ORF Transcript_11787/g.32819 Transcript_11787/m.32819 type:complete len:99 (-) Transcript_11787:543-839(-)
MTWIKFRYLRYFLFRTHNCFSVQSNVKRANKLLNQMGRSLITDKFLLCLVLFIVLGIIVIVVAKILGVSLKADSGGFVIDCSLDLFKKTNDCQGIPKQ